MIDFENENQKRGERAISTSAQAAEDLKKGDPLVSFVSHGSVWWRKATVLEVVEAIAREDEKAFSMVMAPLHGTLSDRDARHQRQVDNLSSSLRALWKDTQARLQTKSGGGTFRDFSFHFSAAVLGLAIGRYILGVI